MALTTLHYDVITTIISFLDSRDALNLALASKHFYELAINQVATTVHCTSPKRIAAAWEVLVSSKTHRIRHVRTLRVGDVGLKVTKNPDGRNPHIWMFGELVLQGQNISCIFLRGASILESQCVSAAFQTVTNLVHLELFGGYDSRTLAVLGSLRSPLRVLSLRAHEDRASPLLDVLVSLTPHQSSLRVLRVTGRSHLPHLSLDKIDRDSLPRFPLLRRLILAQAYYHSSVDLFATFPNVEVLNFPYIRVQPIQGKVPPLRHLELHATRLGQLAGRFSGIRYLHLFNGVVLGSGSSVTLLATLDAVQEVSPIALHLNVHSSSADAKNTKIWDGLASVAPNLRCLDLLFEPISSYSRSNVGGVYDEIALWMRSLSFQSDEKFLPIQCLRIGMSFRTAFNVSLCSRPWFDGAEPAEEERPVADAIRDLPETIASAIPTLQYLAISTQADYYPIVMEDWYNDESDYDLHALDADVTWWRIEREGGRPFVRRMGKMEGEHVWRSLIERDPEEPTGAQC